LDAAGGQPAWESAVEAWRVAQQRAWADPGRLHQAGQQALVLLHAARASVAAHLGVRPDGLYFAASGVGALQAALVGVLDVAGLGNGRLVLSAVEPLAAFDVADRHVRHGGAVSVVPVDARGCLDIAALETELQSDVVAVVVQAANAEVGTRQPLAQIHRLTTALGVPLIVDASQVIGHDDVLALGDTWDLLIGHSKDWASPVPVGVLAVRTPQMWRAPYGTRHGWLGGTADVPGAVAAATALETALAQRDAQAAQHTAQIDRIRSFLAQHIKDVDIVGDDVDRLPHILTFSLLYVAGDQIVNALDARGFAVASGSACVVDSDRASHVLAAMGALTGGNVRISLPFGIRDDVIDAFLEVLPQAISHVREEI
jgi:cysteine desulfurase